MTDGQLDGHKTKQNKNNEKKKKHLQATKSKKECLSNVEMVGGLLPLLKHNKQTRSQEPYKTLQKKFFWSAYK